MTRGVCVGPVNNCRLLAGRMACIELHNRPFRPVATLTEEVWSMMMMIPRRALSSGLFFGLGVFAFTIAAAFWRDCVEQRRVARSDEEALLRLDSDLG